MDWYSDAAEKITRKLLKKGIKFEANAQELRIIAARAAFRSLPAITDFNPKGNHRDLTALAGFRACYLMDFCLQHGSSNNIQLGLRESIATLKASASKIDPNSMESQMDHGAMIAWGSTIECIAEAAKTFLPESENIKRKDRVRILNQILTDSTFSRDHEPENKFAISLIYDLAKIEASSPQTISHLSNQPLIPPWEIDPDDPLVNHNAGLYIDDLSRNISRLDRRAETKRPEWSIWLNWLEKAFVGESPRLAMADGILSVPNDNWSLGFSSVYSSMDITVLLGSAHKLLDKLVVTIDSLDLNLRVIGHNSREASDAERALRSGLSNIRETAANASRAINDRAADISQIRKALTKFAKAAEVASLYFLAKLDKGIDKVIETVAEAGTKWTFRAVAAVVVVKEVNQLDLLARSIESAAEVAQTIVHLIGG